VAQGEVFGWGWNIEGQLGIDLRALTLKEFGPNSTNGDR
jgi:Regulator of chromosome condensation (RCC1) repeat